MNKSPCKDCSRRCLHCHSSCADYAAYRMRLESAAAARREVTAFDSFRCDVRREIIKLHHRKEGAFK